MKKLYEYIEDDKYVEFDDESIKSNLYLVTLVKSLREIAGFREKNIDCCKFETENDWLYNGCQRILNIPTISIDQLKMKVNPNYQSCDCLFYNASTSNNRLSLLIEFKNVNKSSILKYLKSNGNDSIHNKVKFSTVLMKNDVEFEGGFTGEELINNTHFIIVYGDRADTPSEMNYFNIEKKKVEKDNNGRQKKAVSFNKNNKEANSKKDHDEIMKSFGKKIQELNLASTPDDFFGVRVSDPTASKVKGYSKSRNFTMLTKKDFAKLVDDVKYFDNWNWGNCAELLFNSDT